MDLERNLRETGRLRKERQEQQQVEQQLRSLERLNKSIETKFRTTFIGALSAFEEEFGLQWGDRKPEHSITDEQYNARKRWERVRMTILNNGNNQLRAAQSEISQYTVERNRYQTFVPVREPERDGRDGY